MNMNAINLKDLAKTAVDATSGGVGLNEAVAKVAKDNELNPTQIRRVVEAANHEANGRMYKQAKDRRFAFDLATQDGVMKLLGAGEGTKTASEQSSGSDEQAAFFALKKYDMSKIAGAAPVPVNRYTSMNGPEALRAGLAQELLHASNKLAQYHAEARAEAVAAQIEIQSKMATLTTELRRLVLDEGASFGEIYKVARSGMPKEVGNLIGDIFTKQAKMLGATTKLANAVEDKLLKQFDPSGYEELRGKQINGNNPLFIHLKPLVKQFFDRWSCDMMCDGYNNLNAGVVTAIHDLKTTDDVKDYIANEVQPFAYGVRQGVKEACQYVLDHADDQTWFAKKANFGAVAKHLLKSLQVASIVNQLLGSVGSVGGAAKNFMKDLNAPGHVRTGTGMA